jgi:hypothetical protein
MLLHSRPQALMDQSTADQQEIRAITEGDQRDLTTLLSAGQPPVGRFGNDLMARSGTKAE